MRRRKRTRIQPYLDDAVANRLTAYCAATGLTLSALVQESVCRRLNDEDDTALLLRRLDRLGRAEERTNRDVAILTEAFGTWVEIWFAHTPLLTSKPNPSLSCRKCGRSARSTSLSYALAFSWGTARRRCAHCADRDRPPTFFLMRATLLIRQSHTEGDEVMATTKTKTRQRITLPPVLVDVLRWHIATQLTTPEQTASELLFPAEDGGFRSRSALKKPFVAVATAIGLTKHVSPKAMRRTFQDLARAAEVKDIVTRAISGHATETMQHHYSTVAAEEKKLAIAKVIELAGVRGTLAGGPSGRGGMHGGMHDPESKKAARH
jgi:hypothetical protein